jgi:hypothetical protein
MASLIHGEQGTGFEIGLDEAGHKRVPFSFGKPGLLRVTGRQQRDNRHESTETKPAVHHHLRGVLAVAPAQFFPFVSDMQGTLTPAPAVELHAALLQAAITAGLALLCGFLFSRYRKPYFGWWAIAWSSPGGPHSLFCMRPWCFPVKSDGAAGILPSYCSRLSGRTSRSIDWIISSGLPDPQ